MKKLRTYETSITYQSTLRRITQGLSAMSAHRNSFLAGLLVFICHIQKSCISRFRYSIRSVHVDGGYRRRRFGRLQCLNLRDQFDKVKVLQSSETSVANSRQSITSQKILIFIHTAERTSNLTYVYYSFP